MVEFAELILVISSSALWYFCGRYIGEDIAFRRMMEIIKKVSDELRKRQQQLIY